MLSQIECHLSIWEEQVKPVSNAFYKLINPGHLLKIIGLPYKFLYLTLSEKLFALYIYSLGKLVHLDHHLAFITLY